MLDIYLITQEEMNYGGLKIIDLKIKSFLKSEFKNILLKHLNTYAVEIQSKEIKWKIKEIREERWHMRFIEVQSNEVTYSYLQELILRVSTISWEILEG